MNAPNDLDRLKAEYADRARRFSDSDRYSPLNPAYLFMIQQRQRAEVRLLRRLGIRSLKEQKLLEVGCGRGNVLYEMMWFGIPPKQLHGTELMPTSLHEAQRRFSALPLTCADARQLPYPSNHFDVVLQYTVFSSILDDGIKSRIAREMLRVVKKTGGLILWYDFWLNPTNPHTRGVGKSEIKQLFPNCRFTFQRVTLAPPLARRLVPVSWILATLLEKLWVLNTHYLVAIMPK